MRYNVERGAVTLRRIESTDLAYHAAPGAVGLSQASVVRWKLFTLDHQMAVRAIGCFLENDRNAVAETLKQTLIG